MLDHRVDCLLKHDHSITGFDVVVRASCKGVARRHVRQFDRESRALSKRQGVFKNGHLVRSRQNAMMT